MIGVSAAQLFLGTIRPGDKTTPPVDKRPPPGAQEKGVGGVGGRE